MVTFCITVSAYYRSIMNVITLSGPYDFALRTRLDKSKMTFIPTQRNIHCKTSYPFCQIHQNQFLWFWPHFLGNLVKGFREYVKYTNKISMMLEAPVHFEIMKRHVALLFLLTKIQFSILQHKTRKIQDGLDSLGLDRHSLQNQQWISQVHQNKFSLF